MQDITIIHLPFRISFFHSHDEWYRLKWLAERLVCKQHIYEHIQVILYENWKAINQSNRKSFRKFTIKNIKWEYLWETLHIQAKQNWHKTTLTLVS